MDGCRMPLVSMMDGSFGPAIMADEEGKLVHMNEAAESLFEFVLKKDHDTHVKSLMSLELPSTLGDVAWSNVIGALQSNAPPKKMTAACFKKSGNKFEAQVKVSLVEVTDWCDNCKNTITIYISPIQAEARFDNMTRYMSTLLQMVTSIIETSLDPIFQIDQRGTIQMVNEAAVKTFGFSREEFMGGNVKMITGGEHSKHHDEYLAKYLRTGDKKVIGKKRELPARRKDGTEFPIELGLVEIPNESNQEKMFVGFIRDLTEIKKKENLAIGIVQASIDPVLGIDEKGIIQFVNQAAVKQFGFTEEEFIGSSINRIVGAKHASKHDSYLENYLKTGDAKLMGTRRVIPARRKDGTEFQIELGLSEIKSYHGDGRIYVGFIRDLTEIKKKTNLANGIVEASLDPVFGIDQKGIIQFVNQAAVKQFGFTEEEFVGGSINRIVGAKHASKHDSYLSNYLKTGDAKLMGTRRVIPGRRKDGSEFQIELGLSEIKSFDGEERVFVGFVRDLTELKNHEKLSAGIVEASLDPVFGIDETGIIQFVNDAAVEQFGFTEKEFVGGSISRIVGAKHAHKHDSYLANYLKTGNAKLMGTRRVLPARRKDGSEFEIELGISEVKSYHGKGRVFVGFVRDLTDLKKQQNLATGIVAASLDPVFGIDETGIIEFVNNAALTDFGYKESALLGQSISLIVGAQHADKHDDYLKQYLRTGNATLMGTKRVIPARRKDGSEFPIELGLSEIRSYSGKDRMFVGFIRALSDRENKT